MDAHAYENSLGIGSNLRNNAFNQVGDIKMDRKNYLQEIRMNIKKQVDIIMNRFLPMNIKREDKRFVVIIEKKKNYDNFRCPICMLVFFKPVITKCAHIFCKECIEQAFKKFNYCPMCRKDIKEFKLEDVSNRFLGREYETIKVRCCKCREITNIQNYEQHLQSHYESSIDSINHSVSRYHTIHDKKEHKTFSSLNCYNNDGKGKQYDQSCNTFNISVESVNPFFKKFYSFFNKRIKIDDMHEFIKCVQEGDKGIDIQIHNIHLIFGKKNAQGDSPYKTVDIDDITCDAFLIVQLKRKKVKRSKGSGEKIAGFMSKFSNSTCNLTGSSSHFIFRNTKRAGSTTLLITNENFLQSGKDIDEQKNKTKKMYSDEHYNMFQTKMLRKNKSNKYVFVLFEYNAKNLFFTVLKNIPIFKNMYMTRIVTFAAKGNTHRGVHNDGGGIHNDDTDSRNKYTDEQKLEQLFSVLKEKTISNTYHKYFYNSLHLFSDIVDKWNSQCIELYGDDDAEYSADSFVVQESVLHFEKKDYYFKNNYVMDHELMFFLFYLKYEFAVPSCMEYTTLYCEEFLNKILCNDSDSRSNDNSGCDCNAGNSKNCRPLDYTILITDVYTYKDQHLGEYEKDAQYKDEQPLCAPRIFSSGKDNVNINIVIRMRRGKAKKQDQWMGESSCLGKGRKMSTCTSTNYKDLQNYDNIQDLCYLNFSYSEKGFQWHVDKSFHFINDIEHKQIKVFCSIDKLMLFFFSIRNKKYNSIFWNSTHLLQYLLHYCGE
ncbi:RING zinc finger protein, putative [Plasmodium malariae]|uniref:RING zinc finger protein, putative n=1 Tax=Plasmodium malariae TaxID=5858 RepID=A0A1C3KLT0_PLAMA|nr:RING zinc finger protein, putative [Plasmodium malariae]